MKLLNNCVIEYCPECIHFGVLDDEMETTFCKLFAEFTKVPMGRIHPTCPLKDCFIINGLPLHVRSIAITEHDTKPDDVDYVIVVKK